MTNIKIAEILAQLRTSKGVTQDDVSKALGISNKTISKWENGTSSPDLTMLVALAEYYNVSTDTLLGLSDDMKSIPVAISNTLGGLERNELILKISEIIYGIFFTAVGHQPPRLAKQAQRPHQFLRSRMLHLDQVYPWRNFTVLL